MSIEVIDLKVQYGERIIFQDINLNIEQNEVLTILGPNGAGKTTLLNTVAGLLGQTSGQIRYDGHKQKEIGARELALLLGYVPQTIESTFDFSVLEYVVTGCAPQIGTFSRPEQVHYDIALRAIEQMGISNLVEQSYRQISGGERQQVSIARVLAQKPSYIMMDEPTSHLDYGNQIRVLKLIKELKKQGYGVVFTTHNPDHALLLGGKVAVINKQGTMQIGKVNDIINAEFLTELYGTQLCVEKLESTGRSVCYAPELK
ncbi:MAG: ABC transporter ATP-binding protein [Eubacteriales bacterium]